MPIKSIALIGLGAIGGPIAHKLNKFYNDNFFLVASGKRKIALASQDFYINGDYFKSNIISNTNETIAGIDLLIVCVKNYDLDSSVYDINNIVTENTIILPLQNGITSYELFCKIYPQNIVLEAFIQGPDTEKNGSTINYKNPGVIYMGSSTKTTLNYANHVCELLTLAGIDVRLEENIKKLVWKKWMLNVAGNSITALTNADYSHFKFCNDLVILCRKSMHEFLRLADLQGIGLTEEDVEEVINYYISYSGNKKTSMLMDVLHERRTENEYLAGELIRIAEKHHVDMPITKTLYYLLKIKEKIYLNKRL